VVGSGISEREVEVSGKISPYQRTRMVSTLAIHGARISAIVAEMTIFDSAD
jgi:hypothetical protein